MTRVRRLEFMVTTSPLSMIFGVALFLICYQSVGADHPVKQDYVSAARSRFVQITSECWLGSGFLTGYREEEKAEVMAAYHLIRCGAVGTEHQSAIVRVDGIMAEMRGADPDQDLLRLLVPISTDLPPISIRTATSAGEPVFTVGSNPQGDRSVITWGYTLIAPPGEVTVKVPLPRGGSGGQLVSAIDGALLGMVVREEFGFANAVSSGALLLFLERHRNRESYLGSVAN